jgi:ferric-dicitrate binding protein FerR (iron transport regulator)
VNPTLRSRLDELFVRYWDDTLTPAEADELSRLLADHAAARAQFQLSCAQVITATELPALTPQPAEVEVGPPCPTPRSEPVPPALAPAAPAERRGWSRRGVLGLLGGGVAASVGSIVLGRWLLTRHDDRVQLTAARGTVRMHGPDGHPLPAYGLVPNGAQVSTAGVGAAVTLSYPDGSTVSLIGDSAVTVAGGGRELRLLQGTAGVDLVSRADPENRITVSTDLLTLPKLSGTRLTLGQVERASDVEVQHGTVAVSAPTGEPLAVVREGEWLTVRPNGDRHQRRTPPPPDAFAWDFGSAGGWAVGRHEVGRDGPVVRPVEYADPYYDHAVLFQMRSEQPWARGFFRLAEDSTVHVRYRARKPSPRGQLCFCVRTPQSRCPDTGMLEYNGGFEATAGQWKWRPVRARDMLDNKHAPKFGAPWVAFLVIFNTFEEDVGLEVAEFRVTPPGKGLT